MAGRGMGMATKGGGCVASGPRNKVIKEKSKTTGPVMMNKGGMAKKMGSSKAKMDGVQKKMGGGMMKKYRKGGSACK